MFGGNLSQQVEPGFTEDEDFGVETIDLNDVKEQDKARLGYSVQIPRVRPIHQELENTNIALERLFEKRRQIHIQSLKVEKALSSKLERRCNEQEEQQEVNDNVDQDSKNLPKQSLRQEARSLLFERFRGVRPRSAASLPPNPLSEPRQLSFQKEENDNISSAKWPSSRRAVLPPVEHLDIADAEDIIDRFDTEAQEEYKEGDNRQKDFEARVVYDSKSRLVPYYKPEEEDDDTLVFESRFESGNLLSVTQIGKYDYQLYLAPDTRTSGHQMWFCKFILTKERLDFRVQNMKKDALYRFYIMNLKKANSLYTKGMRPLVYSEKSAAECRIGWQRLQDDTLKYYRMPRDLSSFVLEFSPTVKGNSFPKLNDI